MKSATYAVAYLALNAAALVAAEAPLVTHVQFRGTSALPLAEISAGLLTRAGEFLSQDDLRADSETILERYQEEGFAFVEVEPEVVEELEGYAAVRWRVVEGSRVYLDDVRILGHEKLTRSEILNALGLPSRGLLGFLERRFYRPRALLDGLDRLRALYRSRGHFRAQIGLEDMALDTCLHWLSVSIRVVEGPSCILDSVQITGNRLFPRARLLDVLDVTTDVEYSGEAIARAAERLAQWYQEHSDSVALVTVRHRLRENNRVLTVFEVRENAHRFVGQISVEGNWKTKDRVIRRHLSISPGDPLKSVELEQSKKRLEELGFFEEVEVRLEKTADEKIYDVSVRVKEKEFTGLWQLGGGASSGKGALAYIRVQGTNLDLFRLPRSLVDWEGAFVGGGQILDLELIPGSKESLFALKFHEPWLFSSDRTLSLVGANEILDREAYDEIRLRGRLEIRNFLERSHRLSLALAFTGEDVEIEDVATSAPPDVTGVRGHTLLSYPSLALRFDDVETNSYSGPSGVLSELQLDLASSLTGSEIDFGRVVGSINLFQPFFGRDPDLRHILHVGVRSGWSTHLDGHSFPIFERFFLGGPRSLRGFRYRRLGPHESGVPLGGRALLAGTVEYSLPLLVREARVVLFFDWGNLEPSWENFSTGRMRTAAGVGLQLRLSGFGLVPPGQVIPVNLYFTKALSSEDRDREEIFAFTLGYSF